MCCRYKERYLDAQIPDAYERLILDCIRGGRLLLVASYSLGSSMRLLPGLAFCFDERHARTPPRTACIHAAPHTTHVCSMHGLGSSVCWHHAGLLPAQSCHLIQLLNCSVLTWLPPASPQP